MHQDAHCAAGDAFQQALSALHRPSLEVCLLGRRSVDAQLVDPHLDREILDGLLMGAVEPVGDPEDASEPLKGSLLGFR